MDERKAAILKAIVKEYVETGQPVGSSTAARISALGISPATVRNEMAVLEREGYVTHPHTSAGRIPTDKGYRFFVDHLARLHRELRPPARQAVSDFFATAHHAMEDMLHETSLLLSRITEHAALVVGPQPDAARVRSVQLVRLHDRGVLVVAVLSNGAVEQHFLELNDAIDDARVAAATAVMDAALRDTVFSDLPHPRRTGDAPTDRLAAQARDALASRAASPAPESVFVGGASRIAADHDAFAAAETVARLLELLEGQYVIVALVNDLIDQGVTVRIGSENELADLRECSVVLARYDVGGQAAGTVGVLGPTRMNYAQAMAAVAVVSERLGRRLSPPR
jgi:heat-inducible transcriptional repressor